MPEQTPTPQNPQDSDPLQSPIAPEQSNQRTLEALQKLDDRGQMYTTLGELALGVSPGEVPPKPTDIKTNGIFDRFVASIIDGKRRKRDYAQLDRTILLGRVDGNVALGRGQDLLIGNRRVPIVRPAIEARNPEESRDFVKIDKHSARGVRKLQRQTTRRNVALNTVLGGSKTLSSRRSKKIERLKKKLDNK